MEGHKAKIRRGQAGVIRSGRSAGGHPYGYRSVLGCPGELEIVEDEAEVIRRISTAYAEDDSPRDIARMLNAEGVPPPRGTRWSASTINGNAARQVGMLLNEA